MGRGANKRPRAIASTGSCDDGVPSRRRDGHRRRQSPPQSSARVHTQHPPTHTRSDLSRRRCRRRRHRRLRRRRLRCRTPRSSYSYLERRGRGEAEGSRRLHRQCQHMHVGRGRGGGGFGLLAGGEHRKALASMTKPFRSSAHTAYQLIFSANGCALSVLSDSTSSTCSDRGVTLGPSSPGWMVDRVDRLAEGAGDSAGAASNVSSSSRCFALRFEAAFALGI